MTRRKTDPLAQAIRDLEDLPRILKALEVLAEAGARVRALAAASSPMNAEAVAPQNMLANATMRWVWTDASGREHSSAPTGPGRNAEEGRADGSATT